MVKYDKNFSTVCNDLVEFSETTETLAFTKRNALLGYQKSTDTNFIFCPDGSPLDYKKEGIDADGKGDFFVRVEALLPGMFIEIPDVGRVKILTVQLGKLFTNRLPGHGINSIQLTEELLNENERDMNIWVVTIDKNLSIVQQYSCVLSPSKKLNPPWLCSRTFAATRTTSTHGPLSGVLVSLTPRHHLSSAWRSER